MPNIAISFGIYPFIYVSYIIHKLLNMEFVKSIYDWSEWIETNMKKIKSV